MKKWIILFVLLVASSAHAYQVDVIASWVDNNTSIDGFRLYQEGVVVVDIPDAAARNWNGVVDVPEGRTTFYLAAYKGGEEAKSEPAILEYMNVELSAPTLIIKFAQ